MIKYTIALLFLCPMMSSAQLDSITNRLQFSGYAEIYYAYDFNEPEDHNRPPFLYSHNRHNEFNLNLGYAKAAYLADNVRANLAFAAGTYMNANYITETGVMRNVYEANVGIKLSKKSNVWVDAGIFNSHIGFESAVSKDCLGLTRSIMAESSPYYEAGAKLTYLSDDSKWLVSGMMLNGWQHIRRPNNNNTPAFGTQLLFSPSKKVTLNYSTFIGNDKPDSQKQMRYFNNLYGIFHLTNDFHFTTGFDFGIEQSSPGSSEYNEWKSAVLVMQYYFTPLFSVSGRGEFYSDPNGVILPTETENGFETIGYSLNLDYHFSENADWRMEGRMLKSKDAIFIKRLEAVNSNFCMTTSIVVLF